MSPFNGATTNAEIGLGILVVALTGPATGASVQAIAPVRVSVAVLLGPLLALVGLATVGGLFSGERDLANVVFGLLPVLGAALKLSHLGVGLLRRP